MMTLPSMAMTSEACRKSAGHVSIESSSGCNQQNHFRNMWDHIYNQRQKRLDEHEGVSCYVNSMQSIRQNASRHMMIIAQMVCPVRLFQLSSPEDALSLGANSELQTRTPAPAANWRAYS